MAEELPSGIEEPPGRDPGERRGGPGPHHVLNNPVGEPDPTEWPDPYERRPDPRFPDEAAQGGAPHIPPGTTSTSEPHPDQDIEARPSEAPERDRLDE